MSNKLISELYMENYNNANKLAYQDFQNLISSPQLEGIVKGEERSRYRGAINVGLLSAQNSLEKKYIVHTLYGGPLGEARAIEEAKIKGYMTANYILKLLPENLRTVYVPTLRGHKTVFEDRKKGIVTREIYVDYEKRQLPFATPGLTTEEYASLLGINIARFMLIGMVNAPRHLRPNFREGSFRTCMIDLDPHDANVFAWTIVDLFPKKSLNYRALLDREDVFLKGVSDYFFNSELPENVSDRKTVDKKLRRMYLDSFVEEIKSLKGSKATPRFDHNKIWH